MHPYRGIRIFSYSHPLGLNLKLPDSIGIRISRPQPAAGWGFFPATCGSCESAVKAGLRGWRVLAGGRW
ncbi:hypothetical protein DVJ83_14455 (plasmid) [Deinococcus wulumuqiensis]|uniref:Uncharacterized protein n=1 Tax=Deinococcus wulumuqiensis TaxID=980427 RepID=A0A345IL01_9DEIO|nr:hypothetical protein DVJ83_14455 [Deinococcus wulumuqiensis]